MPDLRSALIQQLGALLFSNIEVAVELQTARAEIEGLRKTQSKGKAKAEKHLAGATPPKKPKP